jgi:hypothetical protein
LDYKLVLENEFAVKKETLTDLFEEKEVFVVGYGSLLYSKGWKNRGMAHRPTKKDLIECRVDGYERGTYGLYQDPRWRDTIHFYGVVPNDPMHINGTLVRIHTLGDWCALMATECIAGLAKNYNYRVVDVTDKVSGVKLPDNAAVHMVVNEPQNKLRYKTAYPAQYYYREVATGVKKERSLNFQREFIKTGGLDQTQATALYKAAFHRW